MAETLARKLARFTTRLTYEDIPDEIRDKVKARILHAFGTGLAAHESSACRNIKELVISEEAVARGGATILGDGAKVTRPGAAFVNCLYMANRNQHDSYRMLTHPGCQVVPAALAIAEGNDCDGKEFITAVTGGLEVLTRLASNPEIIPAVQAHGFRSSPVFAVFGAAAAAGKLFGLDEDQMVSALALAATFSFGTVEGARTQTGETACQDPSSTRNGVWAAMLAKPGLKGAESGIDGEGGFYHAFTGRRDWDYSTVVEGLGERYELSFMTSKQWPLTGYIQTPVWLAINMAREHYLDPKKVRSVRVEMYHFETTYPSPAFPNPPTAAVMATSSRVAYALKNRDYPQYGSTTGSLDNRESAGEETKDPAMSRLLDRIELVGTTERAPYFPKITITLVDDSTLEGELNGREALRFGLKEENELMRLLAPGLPIAGDQFDRIADTINHLEKQQSVDPLVSLTIPQR